MKGIIRISENINDDNFDNEKSKDNIQNKYDEFKNEKICLIVIGNHNAVSV